MAKAIDNEIKEEIKEEILEAANTEDVIEKVYELEDGTIVKVLIVVAAGTATVILIKNGKKIKEKVVGIGSKLWGVTLGRFIGKRTEEDTEEESEEETDED